MSNQLSAQLLAQMFGQVSDDPYITLVTLSHADFSTIRLANNTEDIVSRANTYSAFPMSITPPTDDGESTREVAINFDNVSLELIDELRSITTEIDVVLELILASDPDTVQMSYSELKLRNITYNAKTISAKLYMDNFLNVEMTSERYTPTNYPGLF